MGAVRVGFSRLADKANTWSVAAKGFTGAGSSRPGARSAQASATVTRMGQDSLRAWFAHRANRARADKATRKRSRLWIRPGVFVETRQPPNHTARSEQQTPPPWRTCGIAPCGQRVEESNAAGSLSTDQSHAGYGIRNKVATAGGAG